MPAFDNRAQWWSLAACQQADPDLFFPISSSATAHELSRAKAICAGCKVVQPCLNYALAAGPVHGIWGGTSEEERRVLMQRQRAESSRRAAVHVPVRSLAGRATGQ
jgi:WhiB family transcriptional regulator, redox-sensing transcriptional regulator